MTGLLVLIAALGPLASLPGDQGICFKTSVDWTDGWGIAQVCLLPAAALVFAVSRAVRPVAAGEPGGSQAGMMWRRPVAALADYLIVVTVVSALSLAGVGPGLRVGVGLLSSVEPAVLAGLFLYVWVQHVLWGRTLGKRLLGVRVVAVRTGGRLGAGKTALRTMIVPLLAFVPEVGLPGLLAGGLWMLVDPEGRVLHDRWLGAAVVRDYAALVNG